MKKFNFKNTWFAVAALFAMSLTNVAFTSCSDDDDEPKAKVQTGIAENTVSVNGKEFPIESVTAKYKEVGVKGWTFSINLGPGIKQLKLQLKSNFIGLEIAENFLGKTHKFEDIYCQTEKIDGETYTLDTEFNWNGSYFYCASITEGNIFAQVNDKKDHLLLQTKFTTENGDEFSINCNSAMKVLNDGRIIVEKPEDVEIYPVTK